jgi:hypothetical protein
VCGPHVAECEEKRKPVSGMNFVISVPWANVKKRKKSSRYEKNAKPKPDETN